MMASYYTRSKVPRTSELVPSECSDVEPSDAAPSAAATLPLTFSIFVGPSVAAAGESGSMSSEPTGPVSALTHPLPVQEGPPSLRGRGVLRPAGSPLVEVSALGYSSVLAGPSEIDACSVEQLLLHSLATGIGEAPQLEQSSSSSRQPPATETPAARSPRLARLASAQRYQEICYARRC